MHLAPMHLFLSKTHLLAMFVSNLTTKGKLFTMLGSLKNQLRGIGMEFNIPVHRVFTFIQGRIKTVGNKSGNIGG